MASSSAVRIGTSNDDVPCAMRTLALEPILSPRIINREPRASDPAGSGAGIRLAALTTLP